MKNNFFYFIIIIYLFFVVNFVILSPRPLTHVPLSQSKRAAKSSQRCLHSAALEMPIAYPQEQHLFIFQNHSGSSNPLLLFFSSCTPTHIICAKPCCFVKLDACLQPLVVLYPSSCAQGTVRPNKQKCRHLEQRKIYCRDHARITGSSCL